MIVGLALIVALVTATYAINACKIRMVTEGRAMWSAALEGLQGLLFVFALIRMIDLTSSAAGALAYVAGAFLGTAGAVAGSRGRRSARTSVCDCASGGPAAAPSAPRPRSNSRSAARLVQ